MYGREEVVEEINDTWSNLSGADKLEVVTVITSRGFGKTFLMKRVVDKIQKKNLSIAKAKEIGRVIAVNCAHFPDLHNNFRSFFNVIILQHIFWLFHGKTVNGVEFLSKNLSYILEPSKIVDRRSRHFCEEVLEMDLGAAIQKLKSLTNAAFGVHSDVAPVFLLDEAQELAFQINEFSAFAGRNHTALSWILNKILPPQRFPLLLAGTWDGSLEKLTEITNAIPKHVSLLPLSGDDVWRFYENRRMLAEKVGILELKKDEGGQHGDSFEDKYEDNEQLVVMVGESLGIPRLLKFACAAEYEAGTDVVFDKFEKKVDLYYRDKGALLSLQKGDLVKLLAVCSTNTSLSYDDDIPGTSLRVADLVRDSLLFPIANNPSFPTSTHRHCYTVPSSWWNHVPLERSLEFPFEPRSLLLRPSDIWSVSRHPRLWGPIYERVLVHSLMAKYCISCLKAPESHTIPLSDLYSLPKDSDFVATLKSYQVNWSQGLDTPNKQVFARSPLKERFVWNTNVPNARSDAVADGFPKNIVMQMKYTTNAPESADILEQQELSISNPLLWFYPWANDHTFQRKFTDKYVVLQEAITNGKLAFLSGTGCLNPSILKQLKLLKRLLNK
eukprot:Lithocolla_globosa_v1_NODE_58_length_7390_cov_243.140014.p1 type:complete len:611 gc:universal NODE_58_length_7390_cov_243.140014:3450-5282(+)